MKRLTARTLEMPGIAHGFFGREGGVSSGLYESLNCGPGSRDDAASVAENRRRAAEALAPGDTRLLSLSQIHSAIVHVLPAWQERPEGDAMVTATPGLALGILTADCAPVLLADAKAKVIGAAHAGWKGALGKNGEGVLEATLQAMEKLGALRDRINAVIGPCISQANYEVGADFRDRFLEDGLRHRRFFVPSDKEGHYRFDLAGYAAHRLTAAGVGSVEGLGICTYPPENGFFSFRRTTHAGEPDYGRQVSAIMLTA
ncbi:MAG TPA: peptidoglycan editing factor PgeF [Rhizomicrobium sp.]|nr:peptidoglycan editing factor PgeF [Rhizomicrobium sp.]